MTKYGTWCSMSSSDFRNLHFCCKSTYFAVYTGKSLDETDKFGFRLAKKHFKKAVVRNICKRIFREFCRTENVPYSKIVLNSIKQTHCSTKVIAADLKELLLKI